MSRYGAPIPPDPWPVVLVGHPNSKQGEHEAPVAEAIIRQRRQLNALAYLDAEEPQP